MQERQQQASGPSGGGPRRPAALGPATIIISSDSDVLASSSSTNFSYNFALTPTRLRAPRRPRWGSRPATAGANGADTFSYGITLGAPFQESEPLLRLPPPPPPPTLLPPPPPSPHKRPFPSAARSGGASKNTLSRKSSLGSIPSSVSPHAQKPFFSGLRRRAKSSSALRDRDGPGEVLGIDSRRPHPTAAKGPVSATVGGSPPAPVPHHHALTPAAKLNRSTDGATSSSSSFPSSYPASRPSGLGSRAMDPTAAFIPGGGRMLSRTGTNPANGFPMAAGGGLMIPPPSAGGLQGESSMVHQHIQEMANKRISTLEYLRKAHEGRVYWFNTLLFDKPDLARMPYFDNRRLARRATNYLLLGLSLPTVIDLNSNTPMEFLRSLNLLLTEFDSFQSLHPETGGPSSGLGRARIPNLNVFRRATPSAKARRSSSANNETLYEDGVTGAAGMNGAAPGSATASGLSSAAGSTTSVMNGLGGSASVVSFGQSEADLLPGEEYVHLLTPSLPFDPDFFETFATLCDVLIDAYTRLLSLLPTPRECNAAVAELFTKADSRVRKLIVQGIVKEFEDTSRNGVRTEVANVGKIVLGGLM